jgi:adenylate kinase
MASIILLGPPGAGKGTQRERLVEKYNFKEIIPGDLMRAEVKNKTDLGLELEYYINNGLLAPHEIAMKIVKKKIDEYHNQGCKDIIFDGFPREIEQSDALEEIIKDYPDYKIKHVIFIDVDDNCVVERIKNRSLTSGRADDSDIEVTKTRIKVYHQKTANVVEKYKKLGLLKIVNGGNDINQVFKDICNILDK